jgi:3-methyladenine DNA glycosylase Tag
MAEVFSSQEKGCFMQDQNWQMPNWWFREKRPTDDNSYFENMCRVIFQAGLNWHVIDNKWPTTRKAFANFDINKVAASLRLTFND